MAGRPPSPAGSATSSASWSVDPSPLLRQSITELLHDPFTPTRRTDFSGLASFSASQNVFPTTSSAVNNSRSNPLTINDFASYLRDVQAPYEAFVASKTSSCQTQPQNSQRKSVSDRVSSKGAAEDVESIVPSAYFSEKFSLLDCEQLADIQASSSTLSSSDRDVVELRLKLAEHTAVLQKQLQINMHSMRAEASTALSQLRELRKALMLATSAARTTRENAEAVAQQTAAGAFEVNALALRKENAIRLKLALGGISRIMNAADDAHVLIDGGQYVGAMHAVEGARASLTHTDLSCVTALAPARAKLARAVERMDVALRDEFRALISADHVNTHQILQVVRLVARLGRSQLALRAFIDDVRKSLDKQLRAVSSLDAAALASRSAAKRASSVYSAFLMALSDVAIDNQSSESSEHADGNAADTLQVPAVTPSDSSSGLASEAPIVPPVTFTFEEAMENSIRKALTTRVSGKSNDQVFEKNLFTDVDGSRDTVLGRLRDEIMEMLCAVVDRLLGSLDESAEYIVLIPEEKVTEFNYFDEAKAALRFGDTVRSLGAVESDINETLGLLGANKSGRANTLRSILSERSLAFVTALHNAHVKSITTAVHSEKWVEAKVHPGICRLVACMTGDVNKVSTVKPYGSGLSKVEQEGMSTSVCIREETYKTISSGLRYVRSVCAFALVAEKLPYAGSEAARRGVELSRLFNALCGRAILGASAIQWSGLRSITARHLSLASRTIALALAMSPHIGSSLKNALTVSQAGVVADLLRKVEKDLRDHHGQLLAKILSIMMERLAVHEEALIALPWGKNLEMSRFETPSLYVTTLAKETVVLHKILWSNLPAGEVCDIFRAVLEAHGSRLSSCYSVLDLKQQWISDRVVADVAHLHKSLAQLEVIQANTEIFRPLARLFQRFVIELRSSVPSHTKISSNHVDPTNVKETEARPSNSKGIDSSSDTSCLPNTSPTQTSTNGPSVLQDSAHRNISHKSSVEMLDANLVGDVVTETVPMPRIADPEDGKDALVDPKSSNPTLAAAPNEESLSEGSSVPPGDAREADILGSEMPATGSAACGIRGEDLSHNSSSSERAADQVSKPCLNGCEDNDYPTTAIDSIVTNLPGLSVTDETVQSSQGVNPEKEVETLSEEQRACDPGSVMRKDNAMRPENNSTLVRNSSKLEDTKIENPDSHARGGIMQ